MEKQKTTGPSGLAPPRDADGAAAMIAQISTLLQGIDGEHERLARAVGDMQLAAMARVAPMQTHLSALVTALELYAQENRAMLTKGGKSKSAKLGTGVLGWRKLPDRVMLPKDKDELAALIARLKKLGFARFVAVKESVSKSALAKEPDVARGIQGISIQEGGVTFFVKVTELGVTVEPDVLYVPKSARVKKGEPAGDEKIAGEGEDN